MYQPSVEVIRLPRLFLHFFDVHFLELKAADQIGSPIVRECELATRLAILAASEVLVPAASYFESAICRRILDGYRPLYDLGGIWLVGSGANTEEFSYAKLQQYPAQSLQHKQYAIASHTTVPPFRSRTASASHDIAERWLVILEDAMSFGAVVKDFQIERPAVFEKRWSCVPEKLEGKAFIVDHVSPLILGRTRNPVLRNRLHSIINEAYFGSYTKEFAAGVVTELIYLAAPHAIPSANWNLPFRTLINRCRNAGILERVAHEQVAKLLEIRNDPVWLACLTGSVERSEKGTGAITLAAQQTDVNAPIQPDRVKSLLKQLRKKKPGPKDASDYQECVLELLGALFATAFAFPKKEQRIHEGRKRIDVTYTNVATRGFFRWLHEVNRIQCLFIMVECKNYTSDPKNPELDQLAGRFSPQRGQFGFLVSRSCKNRDLFRQRCRDTALDSRGYIILLTDADLEALSKAKIEGRESEIDRFLDAEFRALVF